MLRRLTVTFSNLWAARLVTFCHRMDKVGPSWVGKNTVRLRALCVRCPKDRSDAAKNPRTRQGLLGRWIR